MRLLTYSLVILFAVGSSIAQARVPTESPQSLVTTVSMGPDQIFTVKTAQGIATRITFPEKVSESICGDLYDAATGKGTFVIQNSGRNVYVKPVASKGMSNLFVLIDEGPKRQIYSFDLNVVSSPSEAHRIVNVIAAAPAPLPAPSLNQLKPTIAAVTTGIGSTREAAKVVKRASAKPPVLASIVVRDVGAGFWGWVPADVLGNPEQEDPPAPEPTPSQIEDPKTKPPSAATPTKEVRNSKLTNKQEPKTEEPRVIRKSAGVLVGEAIKKQQPLYPLRAMAARVSGAVVVEVTVDESGNVIAARAISGNPLLTDAAVNAARHWKFNPTKLDGRPVKVVGSITFNFVM